MDRRTGLGLDAETYCWILANYSTLLNCLHQWNPYQGHSLNHCPAYDEAAYYWLYSAMCAVYYDQNHNRTEGNSNLRGNEEQQLPSQSVSVVQSEEVANANARMKVLPVRRSEPGIISAIQKSDNEGTNPTDVVTMDMDGDGEEQIIENRNLNQNLEQNHDQIQEQTDPIDLTMKILKTKSTPIIEDGVFQVQQCPLDLTVCRDRDSRGIGTFNQTANNSCNDRHSHQHHHQSLVAEVRNALDFAVVGLELEGQKHAGTESGAEAVEDIRSRSQKQRKSRGSHVCYFCPRVFTAAASLTRHLHTHETIISQYKCDRDGCDQTFLSLDNFLEHILMHVNGHRRPMEFYCPWCLFSASQKNTISAHIDELHGPIETSRMKSTRNKGIRKKNNYDERKATTTSTSIGNNNCKVKTTALNIPRRKYKSKNKPKCIPD